MKFKIKKKGPIIGRVYKVKLFGSDHHTAKVIKSRTRSQVKRHETTVLILDGNRTGQECAIYDTEFVNQEIFKKRC